MRLDIWLVVNGHFETRQRAQHAIKKGLVHINGEVTHKPSMAVDDSFIITVTGNTVRYVSQGGMKLEKAIRHFEIEFEHKRVLDAGASTGGFTDCALQHGASKVYAVDVGSEQLVQSLREHQKVLFRENFDIRDINLSHLDESEVDIIVADISFVSLTLVIPTLKSLVKSGGLMLLLIKPQFELEEKINLKRGIVKNKALQERAIHRVVDFAKMNGLIEMGVVPTDVENEQKKNVEFLALFRKP